MLGVLVWIVVILLICFSVFGGPCLLPLYVLFVVVVGFYFGVKFTFLCGTVRVLRNKYLFLMLNGTY